MNLAEGPLGRRMYDTQEMMTWDQKALIDRAKYPSSYTSLRTAFITPPEVLINRISLLQRLPKEVDETTIIHVNAGAWEMIRVDRDPAKIVKKVLSVAKRMPGQ